MRTSSRDRPLYRDADLGLWVASGAEAVTAVLTSERCRVRPPTEPIPAALHDSPAGTVFRHMVRFNDGAGHCPFKGAISAALEAITTTQAAERSVAWAHALAAEIEPTRDPGRLSRFAFSLPVYVAASLLGIPDDLLPQTAVWVGDFARCLAPGSGPEQIARGGVAAGQLLDLFNDVVPDTTDNLLAILAREARRVGCDEREIIVANGIGFLFQAYDATAGLIGNTLLALASHPEVYARLTANPGLLDDVIDEVLRDDPPVQNTRRFVAKGGEIAGQTMHEGDAILVLLAAAESRPVGQSAPGAFRPRPAGPPHLHLRRWCPCLSRRPARHDHRSSGPRAPARSGPTPRG